MASQTIFKTKGDTKIGTKLFLSYPLQLLYWLWTLSVELWRHRKEKESNSAWTSQLNDMCNSLVRSKSESNLRIKTCKAMLRIIKILDHVCHYDIKTSAVSFKSSRRKHIKEAWPWLTSDCFAWPYFKMFDGVPIEFFRLFEWCLVILSSFLRVKTHSSFVYHILERQTCIEWF